MHRSRLKALGRGRFPPATATLPAAHGPNKERPTPDPLDELYKAPLDEFTGRRNAIAKTLRERGDRATAERVASLRRPALPVWAINQLARREPAAVKALIDTRRSLARTKDPEKLRELGRRRRRAAAALVDKARVLLLDAGHAAGAQTLERISNTLLSVNTPKQEDLLKKGRLDKEVEATGFGDAFTTDLGPLKESSASIKAKERAQKEFKDLSAEARETRAQAKALARKAAQLRRNADAAESQAAVLTRRADQLEKKVKAARDKSRRA